MTIQSLFEWMKGSIICELVTSLKLATKASKTHIQEFWYSIIQRPLAKSHVRPTVFHLKYTLVFLVLSYKLRLSSFYKKINMWLLIEWKFILKCVHNDSVFMVIFLICLPNNVIWHNKFLLKINPSQTLRLNFHLK